MTLLVVLRMVLGNVKWMLDFLHYVVNGLFALADDLQGIDGEAFAQKGKLDLLIM